MEDMMVNLVCDALVVLSTVAAALAVAWLKKRLGVEGMQKIKTELAAKQELAALAVAFAEQAYKDMRGDEKYQKAAEWLTDRAEELGIKLTSDEIKGLIEATLRAFKDEFGEQWAAVAESA